MANSKLKRTYSLDSRIVELVERLALDTRRDYSAIIELAVEEYARKRDKRESNQKDSPDR